MVIVPCPSSAPAISRCKTKLQLQDFVFTCTMSIMFMSISSSMYTWVFTDKHFALPATRCSSLISHLYEKSYSYGKGPFVCSLISFFIRRFLLFSTELKQPLKSLVKSFPYPYCSSMTVPMVIQPNIQLGISDQTNITLSLFSTTLRTANTREELERSWATIEQDIAT